MTPPSDLLRLVETFDRNIEGYKAGRYNEASLRQEYINPLFALLGWDIYNKRGRAEAYKDVVHEESIKIGDKAKAPDYCFRVGGTRKFFLEAKKPSVNIKDDINPAFQLRRYAWSAKLPLGILTDFEEFAEELGEVILSQQKSTSASFSRKQKIQAGTDHLNTLPRKAVKEFIKESLESQERRWEIFKEKFLNKTE